MMKMLVLFERNNQREPNETGHLDHAMRGDLDLEQFLSQCERSVERMGL